MHKNRKILDRLTVLIITISMLAAACTSSTPPGKISPVNTNILSSNSTNLTSTHRIAQSLTIPSTPIQTIEPSQTPRPSPTQTLTLKPTQIFTPTDTPTYAILRATVLVQANCRYGPGAAYLYKYGLYPEFNIEVIGRNDPGTWVVIQAIGGSNPCWVKASLIDIHGDVMSLAPASLPLPRSPFYAHLTGVSAVRKGNSVIISWDPLILRAGDDSLQYPYLIEAWLCQKGKLTFNPIGSWEAIVTVHDEPGCLEPSHARVYGVEKHGYTTWVNIPWPGY